MPDSLHLTGPSIVRDDVYDLYHDLASAIMLAAEQAIERRGAFHLALSGGSTPEQFYMRLVTDVDYRAMPWRQTHVWIVDERRVPESDDRSNMRMIRQTLTDHVPIRSRQVHPMPVLSSQPADEYEAALRQEVADGRLDFVLLGMGDDCHTASLFPRSPALDIRDRWIAINAGPAVTPPDRLTMTYPLLNSARELGVLVTGAKKTAALERISNQLRHHGPDAAAMPITGVQPEDGAITWYLDTAAASQG